MSRRPTFGTQNPSQQPVLDNYSTFRCMPTNKRTLELEQYLLGRYIRIECENEHEGCFYVSRESMTSVQLVDALASAREADCSCQKRLTVLL